MTILVLLINVVGGLGLFLYGLKILSNSLQKISSEKLKGLFDKFTQNKLMGMGVGAVATSILQSSSATTVIMVGFANAGVVGLTQTISVIFGANIGTTITAQIIAFKASNLALPLIGVGAFTWMFSKNTKIKAIGEVILALGLLFFGLKQLGAFLKPLQHTPAFSDMMVQFGQTPLLGIAIGVLITVIVQSSSATTGMIITLASLGLIDFQSAFCLELGSNIGTTVTAQIAAIGTNITARRAAWAHTLFNVIGSLYMWLLLFIPLNGQPIFLQLINSLTPGNVFAGESLARHCANAHTIFNITNAIVLFPFIGIIAKLTKKIVPGKDVTLNEAQFIDDRFTSTPAIGINQALKETQHMLGIAKHMSQDVYKLVYRNKLSVVNEIETREESLNTLQNRILPFLVELNTHQLSESEVQQTTEMIDLVERLERIGDHNVGILSRHQRLLQQQSDINREERESIADLCKLLQKQFHLIQKAYLENDADLVEKVRALDLEAQELEEKIRERCIVQLRKKLIPSREAIVIIESVGHMVRMCHQLYKISRHLHKIQVQQA